MENKKVDNGKKTKKKKEEKKDKKQYSFFLIGFIFFKAVLGSQQN